MTVAAWLQILERIDAFEQVETLQTVRVQNFPLVIEQRTQGQDKQQQPDQQSRRNASAGEAKRPQGQTIWVLVNGKKLEPRFARTGLTNGRVTEIIAGNLQEGETVVTGQNDGAASTRPQQPASPFGQQRRGGGRMR